MDSLEGIDSRFRHAILAAKRAKQLVGGARKKIDMIAENPLTIAIEEIRQGKINFHILEEEEARKFPPEEVEVLEENKEDKEDNEIDRDLFFRTTNVNSGFDEDEDEDEETEEDEDEDDVEDDDEEDEDNDRDDYDNDYDDDDDDGMIYDGDEEDE